MGICRVKRLIGTAGLQHTQRSNDHPLTAWNKHRDNIFALQSQRMDIAGNALRLLVHLLICKVHIVIHHSQLIGCLLHLTTPQRDNSLRVVVINIRLIEAVEQLSLLFREQ